MKASPGRISPADLLRSSQKIAALACYHVCFSSEVTAL